MTHRSQTQPARPAVSVVIPSYDRARWLPETVASVLAQSHPPLELLIVDDGSTDDTADVCARFPPPVRYLRQENAGVGAARNHGAREARGEWLAFLDSDDLWTVDKLQVQLAALRASGAEWSITGCEMIDLEGRALRCRQSFEAAFPLFRDFGVAPDRFFSRFFVRRTVSAAGGEHTVYSGDAFAALFYGNFASPATALVRRELFLRLGGFDPDFRLAEETEFFHRLAAAAPVAIVTSPLLRWRMGQPVSLVSSANVEGLIRNALRSLDRAARLRPELTPGEGMAYRAGKRALLLRLAYAELSLLDRGAARRAIREAWTCGFSYSPKSLALYAAAWMPSPVLRGVHLLKKAVQS